MTNTEIYLKYLTGELTDVELPFPRPIRHEIYLATLCGIEHGMELPAPVTREDALLMYLAENGMGADLPELISEALSSEILEGKEAISSSGEVLTGTMPNNGAFNKVLQANNQKVVIPEGYHDGTGTVSVSLPTTGDELIITDVRYLFYDGARMESMDALLAACQNIKDMSYMFYDNDQVKTLDLSMLDTSNVTLCHELFYRCTALQSVDLTGWNMEKVKTMQKMFYDCSSLTSLDLSSFRTPSLGSLEDTFWGCSKLTSLDLSTFDTSNVHYLTNTFRDCSSLTSLDLSNFDTSNVYNMKYMFDGCTSLKSVNLSSFDTSSTVGLNYMFSDCKALESVDLSNFNTSNVTNMDSMFSNCTSLKSLDFSNFDTGKCTSMYSMFSGAKAIEEITGFSAVNKAGMNVGFPYGSSSAPAALKRLVFRTDLEEGQYAIRSAIKLQYCSFTREGMIEMLNSLPDVSGLGLSSSYTTITITGNPCVKGTLHDGTPCETLSESDIASFSAKGWILSY